MAKQNKNIVLWIIVVAIAIYFIGPQLGLFSTVETCTSNEPLNATALKFLYAEGEAVPVFQGNIWEIKNGLLIPVLNKYDPQYNPNRTILIRFDSETNCSNKLASDKSHWSLDRTVLSENIYYREILVIPEYPNSSASRTMVGSYEWCNSNNNVLVRIIPPYQVPLTNSDLKIIYFDKFFTCQQTNQTQNQTTSCTKSPGEVFCGKCIFGTWLNPAMNVTCHDGMYFIIGGIILGLIILFLLFKK